jgi:hypothetical protein
VIIIAIHPTIIVGLEHRFPYKTRIQSLRWHFLWEFAKGHDARPLSKEVHGVIGDVHEWGNAIMEVLRVHDFWNPGV